MRRPSAAGAAAGEATAGCIGGCCDGRITTGAARLPAGAWRGTATPTLVRSPFGLVRPNRAGSAGGAVRATNAVLAGTRRGSTANRFAYER